MLGALPADDCHLLLDWNYARALVEPVTDGTAQLSAMVRDLTAMAWYPQTMRVTPAQGQGPGAIDPGPLWVCSLVDRSTTPVTSITSDTIGQPGAQWMWLFSSDAVVQAAGGVAANVNDGQSDISVHTGSLWDVDPLEALVEAAVALQRADACLAGLDPDELDASGSFVAVPGGQPTIDSLVSTSAGSGPQWLRDELARRSRAAMLYVIDLAAQNEAGRLPPPDIAQWQHAPNCGTTFANSTPSLSVYCRTLETANTDPVLTGMRRMQLLLALLRTLNVPARLDLRPRTNATGVDLIAPTLPTWTGQAATATPLQIVHSAVPVGAISAPQLTLPTLGRTVFDHTSLSGRGASTYLVDPLQVALPTSVVNQNRTLASAWMRRTLSNGGLIAAMMSGPMATMSYDVLRDQALGLLRFGGVRHLWQLPEIEKLWGAWATELDPATQVVTPIAMRRWQHGVFEASVDGKGKGGLHLLEPLLMQGGNPLAWQLWPAMWGAIQGDGAFLWSPAFPLTERSRDYWFGRVVAYDVALQNRLDQIALVLAGSPDAANVIIPPVPTPPFGMVAMLSTVSWLELDPAVAVLFAPFALRLREA